MQPALQSSPVKQILGLLALLAPLPSAMPARAGGFDIPIVGPARFGGMAGTAISFVGGGASMYINPAGLGRTERANVDVAFTLIDGAVRGTPTFLEPVNVESDRAQIPLPFATASVRLTDFLTLGFGGFIAGGAGGVYRYSFAGTPIKDETQLAFLEGTLGLAVNLDRIGLSFGAGYRLTYGFLKRVRPDTTTNLDLKLSGVNPKGIRLGVQWQINDAWSVGAVYRNKLNVEMSGSGGSALSIDDFESLKGSFVFPARLGVGSRFVFRALAIAVDLEWIFNSQNDVARFTSVPTLPIEVTNTFDWSDQIFVRLGVEYRFLERRLPIRVGLMYESTTTSKAFPNAFQPPPAPGYLFSLGAGYVHGPWQLNAAYARGFSSATVDTDTSTFITMCPNCGGSGEYTLAKANHFMLDFAYDWK